MAVEPARVKTLFLNAADLADPAERAAYLDCECGGDAELRARVQALLNIDAESGIDLCRSERPIETALVSRAVRQESDATQEAATEPVDSRNSQPPPLAPTAEYPPVGDPGAVIAGRYLLVEKIGEGGMGEVWVSKQTEPVKRKVALKLIKCGMDSRAVVQRFEQERQALALMDHPNIARVLDGGLTPNGQPFFVMELVNGLPLNKFCDDMKLALKERLELFVPICQAVQHAHQKGIVHRDLKPANILVTIIDAKPVPKVIDFGVAKATAGKLTDETMSTMFGAVVGTLEYMAPEQAGYSGEGIDTRADIYSLGVILYELLTGLRPIDAKRLKKAALSEMIRIIQEEEPSKPSTRLSTDESLPSLAALRQTNPNKLMSLLRGELDWVVMKCLEKQRDRRYETANGLGRDIQRYLADEVVEARPPSTAYRIKKFVSRRKGQVIAAGFVLLALTAGVIGTTIGLIRAEEQRRLAVAAQYAEIQRADGERRARADAETARSLAEDHERLARRRYYNGQIALTANAIQNGQPTRALDFLQTQRPAIGEEDLRGFEWYHLWHLIHRDRTHILDGHPGGAARISVTPDGKTLATADGAGTLRIWDAETGRLIRAWSVGSSPVLCHAFSSNGLLLACGNGAGRVSIWDVASQSEIGQATLKPACFSLVWLPGQEMLLAGGEDGTVHFLNPKGERRLSFKIHQSRAASHMCVSGDGKSLLTLHPYVGSYLYDLSVTPPKFVRAFPGGYGASFSPDGKSLAVAFYNAVFVHDQATGTEIKRLESHQHGRIHGLAFSPDGKQLLSACFEDRSAVLWDPANGTVLGRWASSDQITDASFVLSGRGWAVRGETGNVELWKPHSGDNLNPRDVIIRSPTFIAPNGSTVLLSGPEELRRWDLLTQTYLSPLPPIDGITGLSRDGSRAISVPSPGHALGFGAGGNPGFDEVTVWDLKDHTRRFALRMNGKAKGAAVLAPSGKWVAAGNDQTPVLWWDISGPQLGPPVQVGDTIGCLAVSPDSSTLVVGSENGFVQLWDVATRSKKGRVQHGRISLSCAAFSPDRTMLVTGDEVGTIRFWDPGTLRPLGTLRGTVELVSMVFFPDGQTLACGREDGTIQIVDAITLQERMTWKAHDTSVVSLAVTPDGGTLVSGTLGGPSRIWRTAHTSEAIAPRPSPTSGKFAVAPRGDSGQ